MAGSCVSQLSHDFLHKLAVRDFCYWPRKEGGCHAATGLGEIVYQLCPACAEVCSFVPPVAWRTPRLTQLSVLITCWTGGFMSHSY